MKLRQLPEDFRVDELANFNISKDEKDFKLYSLEKKGIETFSLLSHLSKRYDIPVHEFGLAGLKDRHAITKQHFTIPSRYEINDFDEKNLRITFLGYVSERMKLGDLEGNHFEITVRSIRKGEVEGVKQKAQNIEVIGVPNYFDSQRFGSVMENKFIAKYLIKKDYENAMKIFLTSYTNSESKRVKDEKKLILKNWMNFQYVEPLTHSLSLVLDAYKKKQNWLDAYKRIAHKLRELYVSAYQSYLWNECVKELLRQVVNKNSLYNIEYNLGALVFYKKLTPEEITKIPTSFKTISEEMTPTETESLIMNKILSRENLSINEFAIKKETGNFFKTHEREIFLKPTEFKISPPLLDEINDKGRKNTFKIIVSFTLPKGSYATIITKRLFNQ